jgi:hypothetical protein
MNKQAKSSRLRMDSRTKRYVKQIPAIISRVNEKTGKFQTYSNRALRRKDAARYKKLRIEA